MAYNRRILEKNDAVADAIFRYGHKSKQFEEALSEYFEVFEEEMAKDPDNGWYGMESPADALADGIYEDYGVEAVEAILEDYERYYDVVEKYTNGRDVRNEELIEEAKKYLAERKEV